MRYTALSVSVLLFVGLASAKHPTSRSASEPHRLCIRLCTHEHLPVCGRNPEGEPRSFNSECEMKNYNCEHPDSKYEYVHDGNCTQNHHPASGSNDIRLCYRLCTHEHQPVCGRNPEGEYRSFPSECEMQNYNCVHPESEYENVHDGDCTEQDRPQFGSEHPRLCIRLCTHEHQPVCGRNPEGEYRSFPSVCVMKNYNCVHRESEYENVHDGNCTEQDRPNSGTDYPRLCIRLCTHEHLPVCGRNSEGDHHSFSSECAMKNYNCVHPESEYEKVHDGDCTEQDRPDSGSEHPKLCMRLCTHEHQPVCSRNSEGEYRSFPSECAMKNYNCAHPESDYENVHDGDCTEQDRPNNGTDYPRLCIRLCTHEHLPVCGRNSEGDHYSFSSECAMKNYNCVHPDAEYEVVHNGTCTQHKRNEECPTVCPLLLRPVCGENSQGDHQTFVNDCERKMYNCIFPESSYTTFVQGTCEENGHDDCPKWCTREYRPRCGRNVEGEYRTFPNQCEMKRYNCENPDSQYDLQHVGSCGQTKRSENCPVVCPLLYRPVCGRNPEGNQRTFSSNCELNRYNCQHPDSTYERVNEGTCEDHSPAQCPTHCPRLLLPVCGKNAEGDHQTFPNECELNRYNCKNTESQYELERPGRCSQEKRSVRCPLFCPLIFFPVCIKTPQGEYLTFANDCELRIYNCRNPSSGYERIGDGSCDKLTGKEGCPKWCTREYRPVCGKNAEGDHKTFNNPCELERYNCHKTDSQYEHEHNGSCTQHKRSEDNEECPEVCPLVWRPVCGTNRLEVHRTFSSECELKAFNCRNPDSKYELLRIGEC